MKIIEDAAGKSSFERSDQAVQYTIITVMQTSDFLDFPGLKGLFPDLFTPGFLVNAILPVPVQIIIVPGVMHFQRNRQGIDQVAGIGVLFKPSLIFTDKQTVRQ